MHFQIRNKEKYLLFSMVCYLLIVSSALLIIFSPVHGYTLLTEYTTTGDTTTGGGSEWARLHFNDYASFVANVTHIEYDGDMVYTSGNLSGTHQVYIRKTSSPFTVYGTWDVQWSSTQVSGSKYHVVVTLDKVSQDNPLSANVYISSTWPSQYYFNYFYGSEHPYSTTWACPAGDANCLLFTSSGDGALGGHYKIFGGTATPDVPVINSVTLFPTCLEPGTGVVLEGNVTGTVDDWTWEVYDQNDVLVFTGSTAIEQMIDPYVLAPGNYSVQLTVENTGGNDFWQQDDFLVVNQSGTCNFTQYNPFPIINTTPTQNVYVTMTMPPSVVVNISGVNEIIDNSYLGNMSAGYRSYVDQIGEGFNTTLVGVVSVVQSPLTMVVNGIAEGISLFSVSVNSLMSYTTIPLAIVGITLSYYPWQIITLITAGIAIDAAFVLIFGVR